MKTLLFLLASIASAASLTLDTTDARCTGTNTAQDCVFTGVENTSPTSVQSSPSLLPNDYGVALTATLTGGGTWTIGAENQSTCDSALFTWWSSTVPPTVAATTSTISANGTVYISPTGGIAGKCAPGTYTHTITLTNSISGTYTFTARQVVLYRQAAPVYLNGLGVTDASLSGSGFTQGTPSNAWVSDLNKVPCSDCRPGGTFNMPGAGGTFNDQLGWMHTQVTPNCFIAAGDAEKSNTSASNTWILVQSFGCSAGTYGSGNWFIFPRTGAATPSYSFVNSGDCCGAGIWTWSTTDPTVIYYFSETSAFSGADTPFRHNTLGPAPAYTQTTDYTMPYATYGRAFGTNFSHQDMNKLNWYGMNTIFDYSGQVTTATSGKTLVWVSGQVFDTTKMLDQWVGTPGGTFQVQSCSDTHNCVLYQDPGNQTNVAATANIPWKLCAFNPVLMVAQGAGYTPTCGDLTAMARPHVSYTAGAPAYIAHDVTASDGLLHMQLGTEPYNVDGSFDPNSPTTLTLQRSWTAMASSGATTTYPFGSTCTPALSATSGATGFNLPGYCVNQAHATAFSTGDGNQWFLTGNDGAQFDAYRMDSVGKTMRPYPYNNGAGNFISQMWTQYQGGEYSGARKAPFMTASTGNTVAPVSWNVTNCTNASPMVVTVTAGSDTGINNTTHNKVLIGGVNGNTACNGSQVVASVASSSGSLHDIWTLSANGNGAYAANTGESTEDVTNAGEVLGDADQIYMLRDIGQQVTRIGHTRSVYYPAMRGGAAYYTVSRASTCFDASCITYTTNNGIPGNYYVVSVATGITDGTNLTSNLFDLTHGITSATIIGSTATLAYSTPDTGNVVIDICQSLRWPDVPGGSSPDSTCVTATNSSGANPRTNIITGLSTLGPNYYRIVANNKWVAWGTLTAGSTPAPRTYGGARIYGPALH